MGRTIHGFKALVVLHSMECKCSFLKLTAMSFLSGIILLKNVDTSVILLWVTTALLCLLVTTCSLTEVLPPLVTVKEV
jgi:hypothetical protein